MALRVSTVGARYEPHTATRQRGTSILHSAMHTIDKAFSENETRFRTLFEAAQIGISINSASGQYIQVNPWLRERLGYTEEELSGQTCLDITHPADLPMSNKLFGELVSGERDTFEIEKRYVRKDGSAMWAQMTAVSVRSEDGKFLYAFAMMQEITTRKFEKKALHNLVAGTASVTGGEFFPE